MNCANVPIAHGFYADVYELFLFKIEFRKPGPSSHSLKMSEVFFVDGL